MVIRIGLNAFRTQWLFRYKRICCVATEQCRSGKPCSKAVYKPVWHIPLLSVQWINSWWWTDELSETCRVSWQNKFVKLVHLDGFIAKKVVQGFAFNELKSAFWNKFQTSIKFFSHFIILTFRHFLLQFLLTQLLVSVLTTEMKTYFRNSGFPC